MRTFTLSLAILFVLSLHAITVASLDPLSTGIGVATAIASTVVFTAIDKLGLLCWTNECCDHSWISPNLTHLAVVLKDRLHGQHLVIDTSLRALKGHLTNKNPSKALVLSFHGWTGGGKNFVSRFIAESLYKNGMNSKFVNLFIATHHFPHASKLETYKDQLREWIKGNVSECGRTLFIFDEMHKMPHGLMDTIKPYIDHYDSINGVDYRKAIFIFLSNTAGQSITQKAYEHWKAGKVREDIRYKEMEEIINISAYNEDEGGLWHSDLIEKHLINAFIPFLPLERIHIKQCIKDDLIEKSFPVTDEILDKVADELIYYPEGSMLYSKSGCKRVSEKVNLVMEDMRFAD